MQRNFWFFIVLFFALSACRSSGESETPPYVRLEGRTMGTYYNVTYADVENRNFQQEIDSLLAALNLEVSTWIDSSTISRFNQADSMLQLGHQPLSSDSRDHRNRHFIRNLQEALAIAARTDSAFDVTVMPLVNYWGFGYTGKKPVTAVDSTAIDSLMAFVGLDKIELRQTEEGAVLYKAAPGVQLDFSGIAKGYGVDLVGAFLERYGLSDYLVDIGGEARAQGRSPRGEAWSIGINVPEEGAGLSEIQVALPLSDRAIATSGNYRNYYEVEGEKYSHTINPDTGYPERNRLLSASVITANCSTADAYATACMVLGLDKAYELVSREEALEGYFIYGTPDGGMAVKYTEGLAPFLEDDNQ